MSLMMTAALGGLGHVIQTHRNKIYLHMFKYIYIYIYIYNHMYKYICIHISLMHITQVQYIYYMVQQIGAGFNN